MLQTKLPSIPLSNTIIINTNESLKKYPNPLNSFPIECKRKVQLNRRSRVLFYYFFERIVVIYKIRQILDVPTMLSKLRYYFSSFLIFHTKIRNIRVNLGIRKRFRRRDWNVSYNRYLELLSEARYDAKSTFSLTVADPLR